MLDLALVSENKLNLICFLANILAFLCAALLHSSISGRRSY